MYGDNFYGDGILFGPAEVTYFVGAAIAGDGSTRIAPILISVAYALAEGDTDIGFNPVLIFAPHAASLGEALTNATGIFIVPLTLSGSASGDGIVVADGLLRLEAASGVLVGEGTLASAAEVLWNLPLATPIGGSALAGVPIYIFSDASGAIRGDAVTAVAAQLIGISGGILAGGAAVGGALAAAVAVLVYALLASPVGDGSLDDGTVALRLVASSDILGEGVLVDAAVVLVYQSVADMLGDAAATGTSVLQYQVGASPTGDGGIASTAVLVGSVLSAIAGDATVVGSTVLRWVTGAAPSGDGAVVALSVLRIVSGSSVLGEGLLNLPPWFLRDGDTDAILASGGAVVYTTDGAGVTVATFVIVPHLTGEGLIALDRDLDDRERGSFYVVSDPSRTHADRDGFGAVGRIIGATGITVVTIYAPVGPVYSEEADNMLIADLVITSAQLLDLFAHPVTLVGAPGAGLAIVPWGIVLQAAGGGSGYTGATPVTTTDAFDEPFAEVLFNTTPVPAWFKYTPTLNGAPLTENAPLLLLSGGSDMVSGNFDVNVRVYYTTVPVV